MLMVPSFMKFVRASGVKKSFVSQIASDCADSTSVNVAGPATSRPPLAVKRPLIVAVEWPRKGPAIDKSPPPVATTIVSPPKIPAVLPGLFILIYAPVHVKVLLTFV